MRSQTPDRHRLNSIDGERTAVKSPARAGAQILVVVTHVPDQVGRLLFTEGEMVCDAGDSTQCVVGVGAGRIDLADDCVLGACDAGQRRHRRVDPAAALMVLHGVERSRWVGQPQFGCLGEQFGDIAEAAVIDGRGIEVHQVGQGQPVRDGKCHAVQLPPALLARMASRHSRRVLPVSCMHTRTGVSSETGSGSSVACVVTVMVGTGTTPWLTDQIDAPVPSSVEQYTVLPFAVVPEEPTGEQSAPTTAADGVTEAVTVVVADADGGGAGAGGAALRADVAGGFGSGV